MNLKNNIHTDISTEGVIQKLPLWMQSYAILARLDRPVGIWLLLIPCFWSMSMASSMQEQSIFYILWMHILFILGAFFMRSAGCVINDLWDQKYDKQVERTKNRPLASGEIKPKQALIFLLLLLFLSFLIFLFLPIKAKILAILSLIPVALYPLAKRFTYFPQLVLGFTFNWGALMGWAAITNDLALPAFFLWIGSVFWTLIYDTVYGLQDMDDDQKLGLKSTAIYFGEKVKAYLIMACFFMAFLWIIAGILAQMNLIYYLGVILLMGLNIYQLLMLNKDNKEECLKFFKQSHKFGWLMLVFIWIGSL